MWKRDICVMASLIVFQYPAGFKEFKKSALTGCPTVGIVRFNSDWLSLKTLRIIYAGIISVGLSIDRSTP